MYSLRMYVFGKTYTVAIIESKCVAYINCDIHDNEIKNYIRNYTFGN